MCRLPGDVIDIIKRTIDRITSERGECKGPVLAIELRKLNDPRLNPKNWCGFQTMKAMLEGMSKFVELDYPNNNRTDLCVRLADRNSQSNPDNQHIASKPTIEDNVDFPEYMRKIFISDDCNKLREEIIGSYDESMTNDCVLRSLLIYTYHWLESNGKLTKTPDGGIVFHTGLYKHNIDPLYMVWTRRDGVTSHLFLSASSREYRDLIRMLKNQRPEKQDFPDLMFEAEREIIPEFGHILKERYYRLPKDVFLMLRNAPDIPENLREAGNRFVADRYFNYLCRHLTGCIADTQSRLKNGTDQPVRYWNKTTNTMCWLIPLRFGITEQVDMALVLEPTVIDNREVYRGCTVLRLKDAFKSARLVGQVTASWLRDAWRE